MKRYGIYLGFIITLMLIIPNILIPQEQVAPTFSLKTPEGILVESSDLKGKVTLLEFFHPLWPVCRGAVPHIEATYKKFKEQKFELISVSVEMGQDKLTRDWIAKLVLPYPIVMADKETLTAYGFKKTPLFLVIDKEGKIQKRIEGFNTQIHSTLEGEIERLL